MSADACNHGLVPTIMKAAVVAIFGARNQSGKALLSHMLLLLSISGAMYRVTAWQPALCLLH